MKPLIGTQGLPTVRGDSVFYPGDLESIDLTVYSELLPLVVARNVVTLKQDDPSYAETVTYEFMQLVGDPTAMAIYNWTAGGAVPLVGEKITRKTNNVVSFVRGYVVTPHELRAARALGKSLDTVRGGNLGYLISRDENALYFDGNADVNIKGVRNFDNSRILTPAHGDWANNARTGLEIIADFRKGYATLTAIDGIDLSQVGCALNTKWREYLNNYVSTTYPGKSIMEAIKDFGWFPKGITFSQTINSDEMLILSSAPRHNQLSLPMNLTRQEQVVIMSNGAYQANYEERTAGAIIRYKEGIVIVNGLED